MVKNCIKIAQITDLHLTQSFENKVLGVNTTATLSFIITQLKKTNYDYILLTGDISDDMSKQSYETAKAALDSLQTKTFWIAGNHDNAILLNEIFSKNKQYINTRSFSFLNWKCIFLNTIKNNNPEGYLNKQELNHLKKELNTQDNIKNIAIITHHHVLPTGTPVIDDFILQNPKSILEIINNNDKIKLIICGHVHGDYKTSQNGINFEGSPATCFQWKKGSQLVEIDTCIGFKEYYFYDDHYDSKTFFFNKTGKQK